MKWLVLCLVFFYPILADPSRFDDYSIYNVKIETGAQLTALQSNRNLYYISEPYKIGQDLQIIVSPEQEPFISEHSFNKTLLVSNVQDLIEKEKITSRAEGFALDKYNRIDEIYQWLDSLAATYPDLITKVKGGDTYEGRSIDGIKFHKNPLNPTIFIESNIHASEWITSASVIWIINELLTSSDPEIQDLANNYNWYFFPVVNPDGYEYSHTTNRLWRKNRSRNGLICWGTDPNRNWDFKWEENNGAGSTNDPCDRIYAGQSAFSEIETRTLGEFLDGVQDELKMYLSFHSCTRMLMSPWGYTAELPQDHDNFMEIMRVAIERLTSVHGMSYSYGNLYHTLTPATGATLDYAYGKLGVKAVFTYELRNEDNNGEYYGFLAPTSEIKVNGEEILQSMVALIGKSKELGYFE